MSDITTYIDLYCERTAAGFMNEPLNALSNISFVLAGWWNWRLSRAEAWHWSGSVLCALAALIGIGSVAFHTVPSVLTQWLDVVPIWLFAIACWLAIVHIVANRSWGKTVLITAASLAGLVLLFAVTGENLTAKPSGAELRPFNGSLQYLPAMLALLVTSTVATIFRHDAKLFLWAAAGVFAAALLFRTVDLNVCPIVPVGTHFLWHLLTGATVALLLRPIVKANGSS